MHTFTVKNKTELLDTVIKSTDVVLDVGFWGQGIKSDSEHWPHRLLLSRAAEVYGIDIEYDENSMQGLDLKKYNKQAAENFSFEIKFDVIFAGDLIEHLVNPGLFLENAKKHLAPGGRLILSTPNTFNLFSIAGKLTREEPVTNSDHTFYFNRRTVRTLLNKCGWKVDQFGFMYTLDYEIEESFKKKFLNLIYKMLSIFTPKYYETMIVIATPDIN